MMHDIEHTTAMNIRRIARFQKTLWSHYRDSGRSLPWRRTRDPYRILISEIMLQQTQVDRVVQKYTAFIKKFPSFRALERASTRDVLLSWQGLGYNRRALSLHKTAHLVVKKYRGVLPRSHDELVALPGIGPYTASAIQAFAFDMPAVFIETNIRSVFIHSFFKNKKDISDAQILPFVEQTLDRKNPREWYYALMDYGSMLKKRIPNPNRTSAHYTKQSRFEGSRRQLRGMFLRALSKKQRIKKQELVGALPADRRAEATGILAELEREGFIRQNRAIISLA